MKTYKPATTPRFPQPCKPPPYQPYRQTQPIPQQYSNQPVQQYPRQPVQQYPTQPNQPIPQQYPNQHNQPISQQYPNQQYPIPPVQQQYQQMQVYQDPNAMAFEQQQQEKLAAFLKQQERERKEFEKKMMSVKSGFGEDPYKILGVKRGVDEKKLKKAYRKLARHCHPDKGGDAVEFNRLTQALMSIMYDLENNTRHDSVSHMERARGDQDVNILGKTKPLFESGRFNIQVFNELFEETRLETANDMGYGYMYNENVDSDMQNVSLNNFNKAVFNNLFEQNTRQHSASNRLAKCIPMEQMQMTHCETLGETMISDFSGAANSLQYSDYKKAHDYRENRVIIPDIPYEKEYKTLNECIMQRSNIKPLTPHEQQELSLQDYNRKMEEQQRLLALQQHENRIQSQWTNIQNRIQYNPLNDPGRLSASVPRPALTYGK